MIRYNSDDDDDDDDDNNDNDNNNNDMIRQNDPDLKVSESVRPGGDNDVRARMRSLLGRAQEEKPYMSTHEISCSYYVR